jgi:phage terminase large subunit GpA-like protein
MNFTRLCPKCGKELTYKRSDHFKRAIKNNSICKPCFYTDKEIHAKRKQILNSEDVRRRISEGTKKGMMSFAPDLLKNRKCQLKRMENVIKPFMEPIWTLTI